MGRVCVAGTAGSQPSPSLLAPAGKTPAKEMKLFHFFCFLNVILLHCLEVSLAIPWQHPILRWIRESRRSWALLEGGMRLVKALALMWCAWGTGQWYRLANEMVVFSGHKLFAQKNPPKWGLAVSFQKAQFLAENVVYYREPVWEYGVAACPQPHPVFICLYFNWIILGSGNYSFE